VRGRDLQWGWRLWIVLLFAMLGRVAFCVAESVGHLCNWPCGGGFKGAVRRMRTMHQWQVVLLPVNHIWTSCRDECLIPSIREVAIGAELWCRLVVV